MDGMNGLAIVVAGERVELRPDRSLHWPAARTLVIADLHVGKSESLRALGVSIPDGVLATDLDRLSRALRSTNASRLIIVGDLVHDAQGIGRTVVERFAAWRRTHRCRIDLVVGNHDRRVAHLPAEWELHLHDPVMVEAPFAFCHDSEDPAGFTWRGHLHPIVTLRDGIDLVRLPCFQVGARYGVLPAFSELTGGASPIRTIGDQLYGIAGDNVLCIDGA
jgi:uncharacterized protein